MTRSSQTIEHYAGKTPTRACELFSGVLGRILRWPRPKAAVLIAGIQAIYLYERLGGWRRMVSLQAPARRNALGGKPPARQPA